jgi:glucosyl-3-phosphoglycerate synthase
MRTFHHAEFPAWRLRAQREESIVVCVLAHDAAATIAATVATLAELRARRVLDEFVVVDAGCADATGAIAAWLGVEVHHQDELLAQYGPVLGRGDLMWRALSVLDGDIVCFLEAGCEPLAPRVACGLLGPVACEPGIVLATGFDRPLVGAGADGGGDRLTALAARPLLAAFYPELAAVRRPLARELAARRDVLAQLSFRTGDGAELALLLDVHAQAGPAAIAQVDLGVRAGRRLALEELAGPAAGALAAVNARLRRDGRLLDDGSQELQRPPLARLASSA